MLLEHDLYVRLIDQAYAVATYLIGNDLTATPDSDDDRDALERAADHVAALAGYQGVDANNISDALWRGLRLKMPQPGRYEFSLTE